MHIALLQNKAGLNKQKTLQRVQDMINKAMQHQPRPDLLILPECFANPYAVSMFAAYAESIPDGDICRFLSEQARKHHVCIVGGTLPERAGQHLYNSCPIFDEQGHLLGVHRKAHLFEIDIPGKISFKESDALNAGNTATNIYFPSLKCSIAIGICFDIRFPEYWLAATQDPQTLLMVVPGAFNFEATGPAHWELLGRARAVDNQVYVAMCSPARDMKASYHAWGHSSVIDPWGNKMAACASAPAIIHAEIKQNHVAEIRKNLPIRSNRRVNVTWNPLLS